MCPLFFSVFLGNGAHGTATNLAGILTWNQNN